jgi:hypothetical protein
VNAKMKKIEILPLEEIKEAEIFEEVATEIKQNVMDFKIQN